MITLYLPKMNAMSWWKAVIKGDPEIDTKSLHFQFYHAFLSFKRVEMLRAIEPENSKLEDLDGDTRSTVEKMMVTSKLFFFES